ncbi:PilZ domain-containing protein [Candidatus Methylobacter oryzae]|uniref:PilZ domain-containing protein n=2 Tax=Candidatus Methylobacter oryzae TaxID=2497749 RepID=A0ABY3C5E6_9GAMM|nr:PilZ domain-containing protein [Candidatus Methylobacter oryzae]
MDKVNMTRNKNRRGFFRIYDEVHLFYKKIDEKSLTEPQSASNELSPTDAKNVPQDFQLRENEPCNVNISASGIAFNCEDSLKEGDCLLIKVLLASGMKPIQTRCRIVYCKNSQLNDSECPYFVGAHFIDMEEQDRDLLAVHVDKKRLRRKWINAFILAAVITVITLPDVIFGLLAGLFHFLFEVFLHILHLAFEFIESNLDHLVEHLFETDVHATQIIVFYILLPFVFYGLYLLWRATPIFYRWCKRKLIVYWSRKKANLLFYWREQSSLNKCKLVVIAVSVIIGYFYFGM